MNLYEEINKQWSEYCLENFLALGVPWKIVEENLDKPWNFKTLSLNIDTTYEVMRNDPFNKFTLEKDIFFRKKFREWFKKSDLKRELIAKLWHPKNYEKFKYYDPEMFSEEEEEE
jgi:hypothetical protein